MYRRPSVGIFSSGDEVTDHTVALEKLTYGQIWDSNRPMLLSALTAEGVQASDLGIIRDSRENIRKALQDALHHDIIVTSGGVSMGTNQE